MSKSNTNFTEAEKELSRILDTVPCDNHFKLQTCNDFRLPSNWEFTNRVNDCFHIAFIRDGRGAYYLENEKVEMEKGKIIFVSSGFYHSRKFDIENIPKMALFRFWLLNNNALTMANSSFTPFAFSFVPQDVTKYNHLFRKLVKIDKEGLFCCSDKMCSALLFELMCELLNDMRELNKTGMKRDQRLMKAERYVQNNITNKIGIDELAYVAKMSKNYFRDQFKRQYGLTPKKYIIREKIKRACMILSESNYTVKQVADYLGYSDPYAFSKQFKAVMGYSPSRLKRDIE